MNEIIIDDLVIPAELQEQVAELLANRYFPWYLGEFQNSTSHVTLKNHFNKFSQSIHDSFQFVHQFITSGEYYSSYSDIILKIGDLAQKKHNLPQKINRAKANLCTRLADKNKDHFQTPHIDECFPHVAMIYYVNDSDGDTVIFKERATDLYSVNSLTEYTRIKAKKGRCVIFDGSILHAGSHPVINNQRFVLNFNFI